ncbi:hypothetical protein Tco_0664162 [Tanacetum coccineum]
MLSKDDYVQWSSKIIRYCKSKPNVKVLAKSILKGPYQYKKVLEPSDDTVTLLVLETYRLQNETELNETEQKQAEVDDQAIHILIILNHPLLPPPSSIASSNSFTNSSLSSSSITNLNLDSPFNQEGSLVGDEIKMSKDSRSLLSSQTRILMGEVGDSGGDGGFAFSILKNGIVNEV